MGIAVWEGGGGAVEAAMFGLRLPHSKALGWGFQVWSCAGDSRFGAVLGIPGLELCWGFQVWSCAGDSRFGAVLGIPGSELCWGLQVWSCAGDSKFGAVLGIPSLELCWGFQVGSAVLLMEKLSG